MENYKMSKYIEEVVQDYRSKKQLVADIRKEELEVDELTQQTVWDFETLIEAILTENADNPMEPMSKDLAVAYKKFIKRISFENFLVGAEDTNYKFKLSEFLATEDPTFVYIGHIEDIVMNVVNKYNKYPNATLIAQLMPVVAQVTHEIAQTSKYYSADWYANRNFDPVLYPIVDGKWTKTNPFTGKSVQQVA